MVQPASQIYNDQRSTFAPLVQLLQQELAQTGNAGVQPQVETLAQFTRYYLQVVQLLEAQLAGADQRRAMSRLEVELMCRTALSAQTLAEAISLCEQFCAMLHPRAGLPGLSVEAGSAVFSLDSLRPQTTRASSLLDITGLFAFQQLFQWLVGVELPLRQVGIGAIARDDVLAFLKLFRAPVLAGGKFYTLEFDRDALQLPVVRTQSDFAGFFEVFPCGVFELTTAALPEQVSALLHAAVRHGDGLPTQQELAASLGIPVSTFRRRLRGHGASFRQLREDCLRESAADLLRDSDDAIADIASRLGFSDAGAFRRACSHWRGLSPRLWREALRREAAT